MSVRQIFEVAAFYIFTVLLASSIIVMYTFVAVVFADLIAGLLYCLIEVIHG